MGVTKEMNKMEKEGSKKESALPMLVLLIVIVIGMIVLVKFLAE